MFLFKKIFSQFLFPLPLCLLLGFTGLGLLWWTKRQKSGKVLVTSALVLLTALSSEPIANGLLRPLESKYGAYLRGAALPVKFVVVLGGAHNSNPQLPLSSQLSDESLKRLVEGIRIYHENPGSKLIVSGGRWLDPVPNARILADVAQGLGVSAFDILLESESKDTEEEARLIAPMVTTNSFVLVTSASHLPRSISIFNRAGLRPEPAPAGQLVKNGSWGPDSFFPSARNLRRGEAAFYEYLGMAWLYLRDGASGAAASPN